MSGSETFGTSVIKADEYVLIAKTMIDNGGSLEQTALEIEFLDDLLALQRMRPVVTSAINRYTASGRIRRDSGMTDLINKRLDQLITDLKAIK